jgi:hypothetical protein
MTLKNKMILLLLIFNITNKLSVKENLKKILLYFWLTLLEPKYKYLVFS